MEVHAWTPGGGSSFRQGAEAAFPGSPDLETAEAAVQRGDLEKDFDIRGFPQRGKYIGEGAHPGCPPGIQEGPWRALPRASPPGRLEPWWVPSFPLLVIPEASWTLIFYIIFTEFLGHFKYR